MSQPEHHRSQKTVFRLSGFRGRLVAVIVVMGFLCIALNAALFYAYAMESFNLVLRHSTLEPALIAERKQEMLGIASALGILSVMLVFVVAIWTLYITHRVAGPIYHLQKVIDQIRDGQSDQRLTLRAKDEFHELARSFNKLVDELQHKSDQAKPSQGQSSQS